MIEEYDSLYDELLDKCNPSKFSVVEFDRFNLANELYASLLEIGKDGSHEKELRLIRDRAIEGLGIHISTTRLFNRLKSILDPENYLHRQPYDKELVENAGKLYARLLQNKENIRTLELLEKDPWMAIIMEEYDYQTLAPQDYLSKYPDGRHSQEVISVVKDDDCFNENHVQDYLNQYPDGRHREEAECYLHDKDDYLRRYPQGKYADQIKTAQKAENKNTIFFAILFALFFGSIPPPIIMYLISSNGGSLNVLLVLGLFANSYIGGFVGLIIGKKRRIGAELAIVLGVLLGFIGWIIAACSKKKEI